MPTPFFDRLKQYYRDLVAVLRGEMSSAAIFPNTTDKGISREEVYATFLKNHLPSACNVKLGGFLFNQQGEDSKQIDIIVTIEDCPQFRLAKGGEHAKAFACVDGTLAVVSVKSILDSESLRETLSNFESIPQHKIDYNWMSLNTAKNAFYDHWPYKIIFAAQGISYETLATTMKSFDDEHPSIPINRKPDLIHVAGSYCARRNRIDVRDGERVIKRETFYKTHVDSDIAAFAIVIQKIQQALVASRSIAFDYSELYNRMFGVSPEHDGPSRSPDETRT